MELFFVNRNIATAILLSLAMAVSACGGKSESSDVPKVSAGENVPPPEGKQWSEMVVQTPDSGYLMGNPGAALKVAEYGSFTCSHCAEFAEKSDAEIAQMVDTGKMSFEFRPFVRDPLDMTMAILAACGGTEMAFPMSHQLFAYQHMLFETVQKAGDDAYVAAMEKPPTERFIALAQMSGLIDFVKQRGIPEDKAKQCLADAKQAETLAGRVQEATGKYNITGTPTILVNGAVMENVAAWEALRAKLKEAGL